jgi:hypothetical protein
MDARASLILKVAKKMFESEHPGSTWQNLTDKADPVTIKSQGKYLARAEHQLLAEGRIESVDQS